MVDVKRCIRSGNRNGMIAGDTLKLFFTAAPTGATATDGVGAVGSAAVRPASVRAVDSAGAV
eukprot:CAMPEP_0115834094 /NCGR_PEP_ID=MMETSP0287-20121206/3508_1 /TAXON_ID=412157 /ORGANISM="Chrysochromulina rotalis, Strain UIO044" /LENGTH=61 /DNA_ID=CAMNT_0003287523 /DNA_START=477 /DNA_END=660 /DNA_ORIENTATION=+